MDRARRNTDYYKRIITELLQIYGLLATFEAGEPLTTIPVFIKGKKYEILPGSSHQEILVQDLAPNKYTYSFGVGSGRGSAKVQKEKLDCLRISGIDAKQITVR